MEYLGITFKTVEWLQSNNNLLESFKEGLKMVVYEKSLAEGVIASGPIRITSVDGNLASVWNNEYLSGTDTEDWGFIKLTNELGIMQEMDIYEEVIEMCLTLISFRLQGFNLPDDRFIHRVVSENFHTCVAGRGEARKYSLGWYEDKVISNRGSFHSLLIVGPCNADLSHISNTISNTLNKLKPLLPRLVDSANDLLVKSRQRPILETKYFVEFRDKKSDFGTDEDLPEGDKQLKDNKVSNNASFTTLSWTYSEWIKPDSPLTVLQRDIFKSDVILRQPLRIVGAAGTGKTLLMQLLAYKRLEVAKAAGIPVSIFYVVHNNEMALNVKDKFQILGAADYLNGRAEQKLVIKTLFEYARDALSLDSTMLIDKDASQTKMFQRMAVTEFIEEVIEDKPEIINKSDLIKKISENLELRDVFADIVVSEIGIGIKGRDLSRDRRRYIESEKPLTRFHGILKREEREFVFDIFTRYNEKVMVKNGLLDSDDVAISFLGLLKTPLWGLRRKKEAFDFVFIDETQLFNQNERQIFRFLTKQSESYLPIVIALDEAQEIRGSSNSGFGALGIEHLANETLANVHRSSKEILQLAFYVIQQTTDLFGTDFPNFTTTSIADKKPNENLKPTIINATDLPQQIKKEISSLRKRGVRQISVIVHAERYFQEIVKGIQKGKKENVVIAERRGELIDPQKPIIYIARPDLIGGQEFDAVIAVGLEHGVTPPLISGHAGLSEALEQQMLREMYLAFTRAKTYLIIMNNQNSSPSSIIQQAINDGIIVRCS
jgi:Cdc6-like AAA superfamily ATPase